MSKVLKGIIIFTIIILVFMGVEVNAETLTLEEIANKFNNSSTVNNYASLGSVWEAKSNENKLNISVRVGETTMNLEYKLEGTVLSAQFSEEDGFIGLSVSKVLIDSIGQLHGYLDGDLFATLNSDEIVNYTVENEGFEIKETSDKKYEIKIDINKKIPLIDVSNVYIQVSDLQDLKTYISGDGSAEKTKGNIWFNKSGYNGENTLLVAEKGEFTENIYKSVISIIEVMFDSSEVRDYVIKNYSSISVGNKEFSGIKIEVNPTKTEFEEGLIPTGSGWEFVRITIDKSLVNKAIEGKDNNIENDEEDNKVDNNNDINNSNNNNNNINNSNNNNKENNNSIKKEDNTIASGNLPKAGFNITLQIVSFILIILILIVFYKKYISYKDIK